MSLRSFVNEALSDWMKGSGPDSDIVISSRIRIARNLRGLSVSDAGDQSTISGSAGSVDRCA